MKTRQSLTRSFAMIVSVAAGIGILMLSASCTSSGKGEPRTEPSIDTAPITTVSGVALPLDAYGLSPEQKILDTQANDLYIRDCMRKAGAEWTGSGLPEATLINEIKEAEKAARFGLVDDAVAAKYGYHGKPTPQLSKLQPQTSPAYAICAKESKLTLGEGAPPADDFALTFRLPGDAASRTVNDSRHITMISQWSDCMRKAGYQFDSPADAAKDANWPTETPTAREIQTARADVLCKKEVNYLSLVVALRTAYEKQLIEENTEALQRLKDYYDKRSKLITRILQSPPG